MCTEHPSSDQKAVHCRHLREEEDFWVFDPWHNLVEEQRIEHDWQIPGKVRIQLRTREACRDGREIWRRKAFSSFVVVLINIIKLIKFILRKLGNSAEEKLRSGWDQGSERGRYTKSGRSQRRAKNPSKNLHWTSNTHFSLFTISPWLDGNLRVIKGSERSRCLLSRSGPGNRRLLFHEWN